MTDRFAHFVAIDWSGAIGERLPGIAVAIANSEGGSPKLVQAPHGKWSRSDVLDWLLHDLPENSLVGLDLGMSFPFADCGGFFPGWNSSPDDARGLWQLVENICANDPHLAASSFVDHPRASAYFRRHGGREGAHFHAPYARGRRGRFRVTEHAQEAQCGCKPYSNFNLVGAAQVGKSSLTGMRMLHRMGDRLPIWPIDPLPRTGSVIVEIYTAIAAIAGGRTATRSKIRTRDELNAALHILGSPPTVFSQNLDDHSSDALITAAWLRKSANRSEFWRPKALTSQIGATEGWTFGVP